MTATPSDDEKQKVWTAYREGKPIRVPLRWNTNVRIILLNPELNPDKITFEQYFSDPVTMIKVQAMHQEYVATVLSKVSDTPSRLPDSWNLYVDNQNTYDGAYFGAPICFEEGQCPSNRPYLTEADVDDFLKMDFSRPLENPWLKSRLKLHKELITAAKDFVYQGRKGKVAPFRLGFDGPVTIAAVLMGSDFFSLFGADPPKAASFMRKIIDAVIARNRALVELDEKWTKSSWGGLADDSIQLISTAMYEQWVLPLHEHWFSSISDTTPSSKRRGIHLCGDVQRHLPLISRKLGVVSFDTGFPIDHGRLRKELGPEIEISGGPPVDLLRYGTPDACAKAAQAILQSGIKAGGRFILQEGNNLPPCSPIENLAAVYQACLEYGVYDR